MVRNQVRSLDTEIDAFKKSIANEEERNERLTVLLNRSQLDCDTSRKLMAQSQAQQEVLQAQYSTYTRMLQETEQVLGHVTGVSMRACGTVTDICGRATFHLSMSEPLTIRLVSL